MSARSSAIRAVTISGYVLECLDLDLDPSLGVGDELPKAGGDVALVALSGRGCWSCRRFGQRRVRPGGRRCGSDLRACEITIAMGERATLRLDTGREVRVEVVREDANGDEIVVRRTAADEPAGAARDLVAVVDAHLAGAARHPPGTTDRRLAADRNREY